MEVVVLYRIVPGKVTHMAVGEDHIFDVEVPFVQDWEKESVNAYVLRDKFLGVQSWSGAFEFLKATGPFSTAERITFKEFERWQKFTKFILVKENREALFSALRNRTLSGEAVEVLKALTGLYFSSFFDGVELSSEIQEALGALYRRSLFDRFESEAKENRGELMRRLTEEELAIIRKAEIENKQALKERVKALCAWFRRPPEKACSIQWLPKSPEEWKEAQELLKTGRVLLDGDAKPGFEFSFPRTALMPVLVIEAQCSLQAIAASIYADYWHGVEYKRCPECGKVFPLGEGKRVGRWQQREHCSEKCKQAGVNRKRPKKTEQKASRRAARKGGKG